MPSDRSTKPHGTFTPASTISRVLGRAGHRSFQVRKNTAFGGHLCRWEQAQQLVRVVHRCGDDTPDDQREAERTEMLTAYRDVLVAAGYPVEWDATRYALLVDPKKENTIHPVPEGNS